QHTSGLARLWHGSHRRAAKGLAIAPLAWRESTEHCASCLRGAQTPPSAETAAPETTRMAVSLAQRRRVVTTPALRFLRAVVTDGASSTQQGVAGGPSA